MNHNIPVIIINWNGANDTLECLDSIIKSNDITFNIHLVDNNSDHEDQVVLKQYCKDKEYIKFWPMDINHGFAKANNIVLNTIIKTESTPKYVALLNNDTVVDPNWLYELTRAAETHQADMVSTKMINFYNRELLDSAGHKMLNTGEVLPIGHGDKVTNYNQTSSNFGACAGACLYRTDMLGEIGLFDEYFSTGYEDAELGMRAKMQGYNCIYSPDAIVFHKGGESVKKIFNSKYSLMIQKAIWYSYIKNTPFLLVLINLPFIIIKYSLILIILFCTGKRQEASTIFKSLAFSISNPGRSVRHSFIDLRENALNSFKLVPLQSFFLKSDLKRFYKVIRSRKSAMSSYR